jgi:hypothetical protein
LSTMSSSSGDAPFECKKSNAPFFQMQKTKQKSNM